MLTVTRNGRQKDEPQRQLSKEFVRQWLIERGFQGQIGQKMPEMPDDFVNQVSERYIELFEKITGEPFQRAESGKIEERIFSNITESLKTL